MSDTRKTEGLIIELDQHIRDYRDGGITFTVADTISLLSRVRNVLAAPADAEEWPAAPPAVEAAPRHVAQGPEEPLVERFGIGPHRSEDEGFSDAVIEEIVKCVSARAEPQTNGLAFIRAEAERTRDMGTLGEFWAKVRECAESLAVDLAFRQATIATQPLRALDEEAARVGSVMDFRMRDAAREAARAGTHGAEAMTHMPKTGPDAVLDQSDADNYYLAVENRELRKKVAALEAAAAPRVGATGEGLAERLTDDVVNWAWLAYEETLVRCWKDTEASGRLSMDDWRKLRHHHAAKAARAILTAALSGAPHGDGQAGTAEEENK